MKTAVIYWSGTGNTETMANAVAEGMKEAGAEVTMLTPEQVQPAALSGFGAIALGCPAMGSEVLEEMDFQPMFDGCKNAIGSKRVALFGSYGWGDGQWMRDWERTAATPESLWPATASPAAKRRTTRRWPPAASWARCWPADPPLFTILPLSHIRKGRRAAGRLSFRV